MNIIEACIKLKISRIDIIDSEHIRLRGDGFNSPTTTKDIETKLCELLRPKWDEIPAKYRYLTCNAVGVWEAHITEPGCNLGHWFGGGDQIQVVDTGILVHKYQNCCYQRPFDNADEYWDATFKQLVTGTVKMMEETCEKLMALAKQK